MVVAEKTTHSRFQDPEEQYWRLCARAVEECLRRFPSLTLHIDKRYTNPNPTLRVAHEQAIRGAVKQFGQRLVIEHRDSARDSALQQADLVVWAFLQKSTHGDDSFARLIHDRVVVETVLRGW